MRLPHLPPEKLFNRASETAHSYGFRPFSSFSDEFREEKQIPIVDQGSVEEQHKRRLSKLLRFFFERSLHATATEPFFVFHSNITKESLLPTEQQRQGKAYFSLTCLGSEGPYAEALLLVCAEHIFRKLGIKQPLIRINSMGTREDSKEYFSRLAKTVRRTKRLINARCADLIASGNLVDAHPLLYNSAEGIAEHLTPSIKILSDNAREHFERIIEHLDMHEFRYELSPDLIEETRFGVHTVFQVTSENSTLIAHGGRYDTLPYFLFRRKFPIVSLMLTLPEKITTSTVQMKKPKRPKVFLVHAGEAAHLRSLRVLSQLCDAGIPVAHRLHRTKVSEQLIPETRSYPFTIVYGQEEAENNRFCLRNTDTRATSLIPLTDTKCIAVKRFIKS